MLSASDHALLRERVKEREGESAICIEPEISDLRYLGSRRERSNIVKFEIFKENHA
jgi:hypothetical protein